MGKYDVIIVGGGPGGSSAAFRLTHAGAHVLVLDKARFPRYKTCGGAVPQSILKHLPFDFDPIVSAQVANVHYNLAGRSQVCIPIADRPVKMFMRDKFDAYLAHQCGAEVRDGCTVREVTEETQGIRIVTERGEVIHAQYLVGANGAKSVVARQLELPRARRPGGAIEVEATVSSHLLERYAHAALFEFGAVPNGYMSYDLILHDLFVSRSCCINPPSHQIHAKAVQAATRAGTHHNVARFQVIERLRQLALA